MKKSLVYCFIFVFIVFLSSMIDAVTYYVSTTGNDANSGTYNSPFRTIQRCANVAQAGDTCLVNPGEYAENINVINSGTPNNFISFRANGAVKIAGFYVNNKPYIRIEGFEITYFNGISCNMAAIHLAASHGSEIIGNTIHHHPCSIGIRNERNNPSNYLIIRNNTLSFIYSTPGNSIGGIGIHSSGDHVLIEGNDISHVGDFTNIWGHYVVLRNNVFHDCYLEDHPEYFLLPNHDPLGHHVDAVQYFQNVQPLHYLLFENNIVRNVPLANVHGGIFRDTDGVISDSDVVYRHNTFYDLGSQMLHINPFKQLRAVHNTVVNVNTYGVRATYPIQISAGSSYVKIINNLFYNSSRQVSWSTPYYVSADSTQGFFADYNFVYMTGTPNPSEPHGILNTNPLFNNFGNSDFSLQSSSSAIDSGGPLTRIAIADSSSGTTLIVEDAKYFQDGWAGVQKDWMAVGSVNNIVEISSINYDTNTITLANSISRNDGDSVWLYRNSNGIRVLYGSAPDMGAYEYTSDYVPPIDSVPPTRSSGSPSGNISAGTNSTTIGLTTNEVATCRYSATLGISYSSMANTFSTTGGTIHSQLITGLTDANSYNYYVRCIDNSGNANPDDYLISFEILISEQPEIPTLDIVTIQDMLNAYQNYKRNEVSLLYFLDKLRRWIVFW